MTRRPFRTAPATTRRTCPNGTVTNDSTVADDVAPNFRERGVVERWEHHHPDLRRASGQRGRAGIPRTSKWWLRANRATVSRVSVNDRQVALRLSSPVTVSQTASVSYFDPTTGDDGNAIQDRSGNDAATLENESVPNDSQAQDTRAPRFERAVMSSNGFSITLVYDEVLDDQNGPAASDFTAEVDGESADLSSNSPVTLSGRTVALRLASAVRELQDVTVTYTDPTGGDDTNAIQDAAGNDAADLIDHKVTNASTVLDQVAPLFQSVAMSTDGATITLTYDEILDGDSGPATANFQIMVQGERRDVSTATVSGKTVELKLATAITTGQTVTVTYNDPTVGIDDLNAIQDRAGNDAASLINEGVTNTSEVSDSTAPKFVRAVMSSDGRSITLTYDEVLDDGNGPGTGDFTVTVDDVSAEPSQVSLSGRTVLLRLGTGVQSLQDVSVSYTDPTGDDDANAIQDAAGNDAVSLIDQEVANASTVLDELAPVFQSATTSGDGTKIILTYDEILDSANKPATANFEITVQGEERGASTVTVIGKTVELGLGSAVTTGQVVTVAYTDPTDGVDDTNAIQDRAGNDAADLTEQEVTNTSGDCRQHGAEVCEGGAGQRWLDDHPDLRRGAGRGERTGDHRLRGHGGWGFAGDFLAGRQGPRQSCCSWAVWCRHSRTSRWPTPIRARTTTRMPSRIRPEMTPSASSDQDRSPMPPRCSTSRRRNSRTRRRLATAPRSSSPTTRCWTAKTSRPPEISRSGCRTNLETCPR